MPPTSASGATQTPRTPASTTTAVRTRPCPRPCSGRKDTRSPSCGWSPAPLFAATPSLPTTTMPTLRMAPTPSPPTSPRASRALRAAAPPPAALGTAFSQRSERPGKSSAPPLTFRCLGDRLPAWLPDEPASDGGRRALPTAPRSLVAASPSPPPLSPSSLSVCHLA